MTPGVARRSVLQAFAGVILAGSSGLVSAEEAAESWSPARTVDGVALQSRPAGDGFLAYRGQVDVCTPAAALEQFVTAPKRFRDWVPHTETASALEDDGRGQRYYVRTSAPWPFKSRDMIYRVRYQPGTDDTLYIDLDGEPEALPERRDAVRMADASGRWVLRERAGRIEVQLRMTVNPGSVPRFFANRRIAATVGGMLANLKARFPC